MAAKNSASVINNNITKLGELHLKKNHKNYLDKIVCKLSQIKNYNHPKIGHYAIKSL